MTLHTKPMPSLLDREVATTANDKFGHKHFANALKSLVESPDNIPPYSIGLLGGWGTGKSTIKSLYLEDLRDDTTRRDGATRHEHIMTITFNAWRFGGAATDIKRALLRHVYQRLGGTEQDIQDQLSNEVRRTILEPRSWREISKQLFENWLWYLIPVLVVFLVWILSSWILMKVLPVEDPIAKSVIALSSGGLLGWLSQSFSDPRRFFVARYAEVNKVELPRTSAEEYESLLTKQLKCFRATKKGKRIERLVIFVDDLDRLSADEMVSGLDAIRTFMEMPLSDGDDDLGIVFVISCDEGRVAAALASKHAQRFSSEIPGAIRNLSDARRFLDRIFQFRLEVPPFPRQDMRDFLRSQLERGLPDVFHDLKSRDVSIESLIDRMGHVGVDNPRKAIQILNAFAQAWWMACVREYAGSGSSTAGGLREGCVTNHPMSLAALCALKVDFPDFYAELQTDERLIKAFTTVYLNESSIDEQPVSVRQVLSQYSMKADKDAKPELKPEHRSLRRYIASLQGHRWPESLEPLLILTQDPITRTYEAGAQPIRDALVSGDVAGVLEQFGRNLDDQNLKREETTLLRNLVEDAQNETPERRDNAFFVATSLSPRLDPVDASQLANMVCAQLYHSINLRSRVGLGAIRNILPHAHPDHKQQICDRLIGDVLSSKPVTLKTQELNTPTITNAVQMAVTTADIALHIWEEHNLSAHSKHILVDWLIARDVQSGDNNDVVKVSHLEQWVTQHEGILLPELGTEYVEIMIGEIANERAEVIDLEDVLRRTQAVLEDLSDSGVEGRKQFWHLLSQLIAVKDQKSVSRGYTIALSHVDDADDVDTSLFMVAFADRLKNEMEAEEEWALDWEEAADSLITFANLQLKHINEEAADHIAALTLMYLEDAGTDHLGTSLLDVVSQVSDKQRDRVIDNCISSLLNSYPDRTLQWFASHLEDQFGDDQKTALVGHLNSSVANSIPDEEVSKSYATFVQALTNASLQAPPIADHVVKAFTFLAQQHGNVTAIERLLHALAPLLRRGLPPRVGPQLQTFFASNAKTPDLLGLSHGFLVGRWPLTTAGLKGYQPEELFNQAVTLGRQHQGNDRTSDLLRSVASMVQDGVVTTDVAKTEVANFACELWRQHRQSARDVIRSLTVAPNVKNTAGLADRTSLGDDTEYEDLKNAWTSIASDLSATDHIAVSNLILQKEAHEGPNGTPPDAALCAWMDALPKDERRRELLLTSLQDESLNQTAKRRLWAQLISNLSCFSTEDLGSLMQLLFKDDTLSDLHGNIVHSLESISDHYQEHDDRRKLAETMMLCLMANTSLKTKRDLGRWLQHFEGEWTVDLAKSQNASLEDLEILKSIYPSNKQLKGLLKSTQAETNVQE